MDNIIVIDGHVFRLETRLSDSPWQDAGGRGSCYDQPDMPVAPVIDFHPYPAVRPEAPDGPPAAPLDTGGETEGSDGGDIQPGNVCGPATDGEPPEAAGIPGPKRRSWKFAQEQQKIITMPDNLALPSRKGYVNAISTIENKIAYLQPIQREAADGLTFKDGVMYLHGMLVKQEDLAQYYDKTPQAVAELDTIILNGLYSALLKDTERRADSLEAVNEMLKDPSCLDHKVTFYVPDLLQKMGYGRNASKGTIQALENKLKGYSNIVGVMKEYGFANTSNVILPVMRFYGREELTNNISFSSPYLNQLALRILQASYISPRDGKPKLKRNGAPETYPVNSYVVKSSIMKERNKRAAQIVCILATLIERTGSGLPAITYNELINRCPSMRHAMDAATTANKNNQIHDQGVLGASLNGLWRIVLSSCTNRVDAAFCPALCSPSSNSCSARFPQIAVVAL